VSGKPPIHPDPPSPNNLYPFVFRMFIAMPVSLRHVTDLEVQKPWLSTPMFADSAWVKEGTRPMSETDGEDSSSPKRQRGTQGDSGDKGSPTPKRQRGAKGDIGAKGDTGAKGVKGASGSSGKRGERGQDGGQGEQGPPGVVDETVVRASVLAAMAGKGREAGHDDTYATMLASELKESRQERKDNESENRKERKEVFTVVVRAHSKLIGEVGAVARSSSKGSQQQPGDIWTDAQKNVVAKFATLSGTGGLGPSDLAGWSDADLETDL
jgi:hypothetical protein